MAAQFQDIILRVRLRDLAAVQEILGATYPRCSECGDYYIDDPEIQADNAEGVCFDCDPEPVS